MKTHRVKERVSLAKARKRLRALEKEQPGQLWKAASLADVIWPDNAFQTAQGAGGAAADVLQRLRVPWVWRRGLQGGYALAGI